MPKVLCCFAPGLEECEGLVSVDLLRRAGIDVTIAAVSRAVARLNLLTELCLPFVKVGGVFLAMKGPGAAEELEEAAHAIEVLGGGEAEILPYNVPSTTNAHNVVRIRKLRETPLKYPRRWAKIQKQPL